MYIFVIAILPMIFRYPDAIYSGAKSLYAKLMMILWSIGFLLALLTKAREEKN